MKHWIKANLKAIRIISVIIITFGVLTLWASSYYRLPPIATIETSVKQLATHMLRYFYSGDLQYNQKKLMTYWVGSPKLIAAILKNTTDSQFIYEELDESYLQALRHKFSLLDFLKSGSNEYENQLKLLAWLGTRWDHGTSPVNGGKERLNPLELILEGENGAKYWCEIASIITVETATALGWPARQLSLSRDGYIMEHGVAELWSNQFNKWFVADTDFNVVFEHKGIPLSAFELCHYGPEWQSQGQLDKNFFAPAKPSLTYKDLLPYYRYVRVDLRNDWLSRDLRRGSPAGGELATIWTARKGSGPVLTSAHREDRREHFNWPVNQTWIKVVRKNSSTIPKVFELAGYSPYYDYFEVQIDDASWHPLPQGTYIYQPQNNVRTFSARMVTQFGHRGPPTHWRMR